MDLFTVPQLLVGSLSHDGIHVDRIDGLAFRMLVQHAADCPEHMVHRFAQILAAVGRNENQFAVANPVQLRMRIVVPDSMLHGVDDGITRDIDGFRIFTFLDKVIRCQLCRGEVVLRHDANGLPVELLRVGRIDIVGAEAGFYMSDRNLKIEAGKSRHEGCGGVAMNKDHIGFLFFQYFPDPVQNIGRDIEQGLTVFHDVQIIVWNNVEGFQYLIQHLTVLGGNAYHGLNPFPCFQLVDERAHLDCFRSCAEDQHHLFQISTPVFLRYDRRRAVRRCYGSPEQPYRPAYPYSP